VGPALCRRRHNAAIVAPARTKNTDHNVPERTTNQGVPKLEGVPSLNTEELIIIQERIINKEVSRRTKLAETHFQKRVESEVSKMKQELNDRKKKEISSLKQKIMMFKTVTNNGTSQKLVLAKAKAHPRGAKITNRSVFLMVLRLVGFEVVAFLIVIVCHSAAG
jgi:hypothetical protein